MHLIEKALSIALKAHTGQIDKVGQPYILHPLRMMMNVETEDEQVVALLHDVIEDSDFTSEDLLEAGIPEYIVIAVEHLTNRDDESYDQFIDRAMQNDLAARVKRADIEDNINVLRLSTVKERDLERIVRYHKAWKKLTGGS